MINIELFEKKTSPLLFNSLYNKQIKGIAIVVLNFTEVGSYRLDFGRKTVIGLYIRLME